MFDKILKLLKSKNNVLYIMVGVIALLTILCIVTGVAACNNCGGCSSCSGGEDDPSKPYLNLVMLDRGEGEKKIDFNSETKAYSCTVAVDEEFINLNEFFTCSDNTVWSVYDDIGGTREIATKILADFDNGANDYYIVVRTLDHREMRMFTLNVYKEYEVSVRFIGKDGVLLPSDTANMPYKDVVENVYNGSWADDGVITFPGDTVLGEGTPAAYPAYAPLGYDFNGWKVDGEYVGQTFTLNRDVEFMADVVAKEYQVVLDENTGADSGEERETATITFGEHYVLPVPERVGYDFLGWKDNNDVMMTDENGKSVKPFSQEYSVFLAEWKIKSFRVCARNLDSNAGQVSNQNKYENYEYNAEVSLTATENEGYTFLGWFEKDATQPVSAEKTYTFKMPAGDVELEARWARYSITINVDEQFKNAGTVTGGGYYTAGTTNIELKATTNGTYTFLGWYQGNTMLSLDPTFIVSMPAEDVVYHAKWARYELIVEMSHTVEGNSVQGAGFYSKGAEFTLTATTTAEGYAFVGWFDSADADEPLSTSATYSGVMGNDNRTVYAKWKIVIVTVTVSFDAGNGSAVADKQVTTFNENVDLGVSTQKGYKFLGWYDGATKITDSDGILDKSEFVADVTLTAKWEAVKVKVTLNPNGGSVDGEYEAVLTYGKSATLPVATGKTGYTFGGWMDGMSTITDENGNLDHPSAYYDDSVTLTFTAKWNPVKVLVKFEQGEGATITANSQEVYYDQVNVSLFVPQHPDKGFEGWMYNGEQITDSSGVLAKVTYLTEITLTAKWGDRVANFNYNAEADADGIPTEPVRVEIGESVTLAIPTKEGYNFDGWYRTDTFEQSAKITDKTGVITNSQFVGSILIYAKWEAKIYTVGINSTSTLGSVSGQGPYKYGQEATVKAVAGEGCTFLGWYISDVLQSENAEYTFTVKSTVTLTAKFKNDYETINTVAELKAIKNGESYILGADINLNGSATNAWTPLAFTDEEGNPVGFNGKLYGNGKKIEGLFVNSADIQNVGLFQFIGSEGVIDGLTVTDATFKDIRHNSTESHLHLNVGVIAGRNAGTIKNCKVSGNITVVKNTSVLQVENAKIGGIVGDNASGAEVFACSFVGSINVGSADIAVKGNFIAVGGIAGYNGYYDYEDRTDKPGSTGTIKAVMADVEINLVHDTEKALIHAAGIVGYNRANLYDAKATGAISATSVSDSQIDNVYVGGIAGYHESSTIARVYADCDITAISNTGNARAGLVVSYLKDSNSTKVYLKDAYCNGTITATSNKGVIAGYVHGKHSDLTDAGTVVIENVYYGAGVTATLTKNGASASLTANPEAVVKNDIDSAFFTDSLGFGLYVDDLDLAENPENVWKVSGKVPYLYFQ